MSALVWFTVSSFHISSEFVAPLRLTHALHASSTSVITRGTSLTGYRNDKRGETQSYRFNTMSRATLPLGPKGF